MKLRKESDDYRAMQDIKTLRNSLINFKFIANFTELSSQFEVETIFKRFKKEQSFADAQIIQAEAGARNTP